MFLHHRILFGFFFELPMIGLLHYRVIWKWDWQEDGGPVPWHRCFTWGEGKALRWVGVNYDGTNVKVIWTNKK